MHKFNGLYKLRNGIVVEAWPQENTYYNAPVKTISVPNGLTLDEEDARDFAIGSINCLRFTNIDDHENPLTWVGGAFGSQFDVLEKLPSTINE